MQKKSSRKSSRRALLLVAGLSTLFIITLPITLYLGQNKQEIRSQAATAPAGVPGTWKLVFDDEFNGTTLDKTKWGPNWYGESGNMNSATTKEANVKVSGGNLILTLASAGSGALVHTDPAQPKPGYLFPVGNYAEASVFFPGSGSTIYNWPAWWASATASDGWPSSGEHDIAEGLGSLTVNYHSPSGSHNQGTISGTWSNAFHTYGIHRQAKKADIYWDGKLVKSYSTDDSGKPEILILNVGSGYTGKTGAGSEVKVDFVRVYAPSTSSEKEVTPQTPSGGSQPGPSGAAQTTPSGVVPTFFCGGSQSCVPSGSPEITPNNTAPTMPVVSLGQNPPQTTIAPSNEPNNPCDNQITDNARRRHQGGNNGNSGFLNAIIQFLQQLLQLLQQLLGGGNGNGNVNNTPGGAPAPAPDPNPTDPCN